MQRFLERLGRSAAHHPWRVVGVWAVVAVALVIGGQAAGGTFLNDFRVPGAEAQRAADLAQEHFPEFGAESADAVVHHPDRPLTDPGPAEELAELREEIGTQPDVTRVEEPAFSDDARTAIVTIRYDKEFGEFTDQAYHRLDAAAEDTRAAGMSVDFSGLVVDAAFEPSSTGAELAGLTAALVVLLVAFGSVVAAGLPIMIALAGLAVGTALVLFVAAAVDIPSAAPIVAVMLGIAAGIDYALFVVSRYRREVLAGYAPVPAVARAVATAGHAVLFAGVTVIVAILGLFLSGIPFVGAMGLAAAVTVVVMVIAALTLLPALLGLVGPNIDRWRVPVPRFTRAGREQAGQESTAATGSSWWARWGAHVMRRPVPYALGATALLLLLSAPLLSLQLGTPDDGNAPEEWPQRQAYDHVAAEFGPGWNAPLLVAVQPPGGAEPLQQQLGEHSAVAQVTPPMVSDDGALALLTVIPEHAPQDEEVTDLVHEIRDTMAPEVLGAAGDAYVGGQTAFMIDFSDEVGANLPVVIAAVVIASTALLLAMFRAPLVAAKAAVMTLLSVSAAYGVVVAVFQWGWGITLVGVDSPVPIMALVPMLLFAILFGLSVDYEVFLLSSMKEEYLATGSPQQAVIAGLANTGRIITAAAIIMAVVFVSFLAINDTLVKMVGLGLAVAVIVDATVIRVALVPAVMRLFGNAMWWPLRSAASEETAETPTTLEAPSR